jgi:ribose 1,5-bisphosphate isomerase
MGSLKKLIEDIKSIKIQGAKEIAIHSLIFLEKFCKKYGFGRKFDIITRKLENVRPTAVVLHNCLEILRKERNLETINKLLNELNEATNKIAKIGGKLLKNNFKIMTHCHSSEVLAVIKKAWNEGRKISVYATKTEPKYQGIKTVKELAELKVPVTLIIDSAVNFFMPDTDIVIIGSDAIRKEGAYNKIGSMFLALSAKENKKPLYIVANTFKLDRRNEITIEERSPHEVYHSLKGVKIRNPAFEKIPWKFITGVVTEKGILKEKDIRKMLR